VHASGGRRAAYRPVPGGPLVSRLGEGLALARGYLDEMVGVRELYVADLDAIAGALPSGAHLAALGSLGAPLWVDAGVVEEERALEVRQLGASRVVVGLETLESMRQLEVVAAAVGGADRVAFSLDLRDGVPLVRSDALRGATPAALAAEAAECGAGTVIVLDLARVGAGRGLDVSLLAGLRALLPPECALAAGGGVRGWRDIELLAGAGCDAVLVASALLDGRLTYRDVVNARHVGGNAERCHES
jgi:phosphoribosylformimino-5-aminoimidazole carboxamide ribotide isomerase